MDTNYLKWLCFSFKGRIGRKIYIVCALSVSLLLVFWIGVNLYLVGLLGERSISYLVTPSILFIITLGYINFALAAKRLHDRGKSAWWYLIVVFIPYLGLIYWIIDMWILKGEQNDNQYGDLKNVNKVKA